MSKPAIHEVRFTTYPKLLFIWPVLFAGFVFWPLGGPPARTAPSAPAVSASQPSSAPATATASESVPKPASRANARLEVLAWIYVWLLVFVFLTLGVDVDRNQAAFWVLLVAAIWVLGLWLRDTKGFTLFGEIYRWFANLDIQYNRNTGLAISILMLVPFVLMILWARLNDHWRITHNEFEHYSFGKMDDSLGRGAKTIRSSFPDVFELLLGLAGTLIVYNASGNKELRRIPHVMFLPFVRKKLNRILERTAITAGEMEDSEEEDEDIH